MLLLLLLLLRDVPAEEIHIDPTAAVDLDTADAKLTIPPLSLRAMMGTFMMTQATHGQLLTEVAALRADFSEYRVAFLPLPPSDS